MPIHKVVCYVVRGSNLLVFRQPKHPEAGLQVPAGTIEPGEAPDVAALREAREETGLDGIRMLGKLGFYTFDMAKWKPELHERHVFALEYAGPAAATWTHVEQHGAGQGTEFEFSWFDLGRGDPGLIADQGRFLSSLRNDANGFLRL